MAGTFNNNRNQNPSSKHNHPIGIFMKRLDTVRADVLKDLLSGKKLTNLDSVYAQSTTRLTAVISALKKKYDWCIESHKVAKATNDGRVAEVAKYWLPEEVIEKAMQMGARAWMEEVKAARAKRKLQTFMRKREAALKNAARGQALDPRQQSLWGDA